MLPPDVPSLNETLVGESVGVIGVVEFVVSPAAEVGRLVVKSKKGREVGGAVTPGTAGALVVGEDTGAGVRRLSTEGIRVCGGRDGDGTTGDGTNVVGPGGVGPGGVGGGEGLGGDGVGLSGL